jgi:hypothetical protein
MTLNVETAFLLISLLASLWVYFKPYKNFRYLRLFPIFLLITICIETFNTYLANRKGNNSAAYGLFGILEFVFYFWILKHAMVNKKAKSFLGYLLWIYPLFALGNMFFIQGFSNFNSISYSVGCFLIVLFCIFYFYGLFQLPSSYDMLRDPLFWICCGLLFFYCCSFPLFGLINFLIKIPGFNPRTLGVILSLMNVVLYSSFTIAFLCRLKVRNSTS